MIGDWVHCITDNTNVQIEEILIDEIYGLCYKYEGKLNALNDIEPIPLTPEVLEKNGFKRIQDTYIFNIGINRFGTYLWIVIGPDSWIENNKIYIDSLKGTIDMTIPVTACEYVHELQHLLKLCKIEKGIIL